MVSNKKYKYALEKWNEWENMAFDAVKRNGTLLKEMKEINDLSMRVNEHNGSLIAECRKLREQLAERDSLLENAESEAAKKIFSELFSKVGFDGHNVSIFKNDLIEVAKKYGVEG